MLPVSDPGTQLPFSKRFGTGLRQQAFSGRAVQHRLPTLFQPSYSLGLDSQSHMEIRDTGIPVPVWAGPVKSPSVL